MRCAAVLSRAHAEAGEDTLRLMSKTYDGIADWYDAEVRTGPGA
jgi:hypothetical protein